MKNCSFSNSNAHHTCRISSANLYYQRNIKKEIKNTTGLQTLKKLSKKNERKVFANKEKSLADSWARKMGYYFNKESLKIKTYEYMKITKKLLEIYKKYSRKFKKFEKFEKFEAVSRISDEFLIFLPLIDNRFSNSPNNYKNGPLPYRKHQTEILNFLIKNYFQTRGWNECKKRTGWFEREKKAENVNLTHNSRLKFRKPEEAIYQFLIHY
ncbi:unnamed protein product [Blepharisma stoltei]|uniref:Uncharacterized protein n=1 Tax=Blepharisma stoltei TaxID=1481888 RepID=A0AAU9IQ34_9CILI|nr:unnamed protein product [Blepharisma stoltei]